jgi:hypothetical protein
MTDAATATGIRDVGAVFVPVADQDDQLHLAFMLLGCAVVCQRRLGDS